jgi:hypothetical protein
MGCQRVFAFLLVGIDGKANTRGVKAHLSEVMTLPLSASQSAVMPSSAVSLYSSVSLSLLLT